MYSSIDQTLTPLLLKNCDEICPLSKFVQITKIIRPDNPMCLYANARNNVEDLINGSIRGGPFNQMKLKFE
jgi:hypothetical protein